MFLIIPTGVNYATKRYPVVTFSLIGANVAVYLAGLIHSFVGADADVVDTWWLNTFWLIPNQSVWYTYITTMFVHAGFFHLIGNMLYLFLFGSAVEDTIGRWKYALLYFVGGFVADFGHILTTSEHFASEIPLGGASGAISACLGAFLILLPKMEVNFRWLLSLFSGRSRENSKWHPGS